jgi:hypothetical protein
VDPALRRASGFAFWNTSKYDFGALLDDHAHLKQNLRNYIQHFSTSLATHRRRDPTPRKPPQIVRPPD